MTPPRLARRLLGRLLPPADREVIRGDIDEEFAARRRTRRGAAWIWYWRQVVTAVPLAVRQRLVPVIGELPGNVRYTLRLWRGSPGFAVSAILTQAIGIAVATTIVAVAFAVLVRPLPYRDAGRIVQIFEGTARPGLFSWQDFVELRNSPRSFEAVAGFSGGSRTLTGEGLAPERVATAEVTDRFFDVLGVTPSTGRGFTASDGARGAAPVVILSHGAWTRRFGQRPAAIGSTILLNGTSHTVVGVLPATFEFPLRGQTELWLPLRPSEAQEQRGYWHWMDVIARERADATPAGVEGELGALAAAFASRDAKFHGSTSLHTEPLREVIVGGVRPTIQALLAGSVLLLMATCATLAGLLVSRSTGRGRELSVRAAVGANRGRLVRQLLTENVLLALVGGLTGMVAGRWLLHAFVAMVPAGQRSALPHGDRIGLDPMTLAAVVGLTLITGLTFGVLPALRTSRHQASGALKGSRSTGGRREGRVRFALVALQVAVAFVLLSGAAVLGASVYRLLAKDPGFDPEGLVTLRLTLSGPRYTEPGAAAIFHEQLLQRFGTLPGVSNVALVSQAPLTGRGDTGTPMVVGRPPLPADTAPDVALRTVSANYFAALGIPLRAGRVFEESLTADGPGLVMVNQLLADRLFGSEDPLGRALTFEFAPGPWTILGVVGNEQLDALDRPPSPVVYFPARQDPMRSFTVMVRTSQPATLASAARAVVSELDPSLPVFGVRTVDELTMQSGAVFMRRAAMWMLAVFAGAAVLLAVVALYGVLTQSVIERTREIGVRMALGARPGHVFGLVFGTGAAAISLGLLGGLAGTAVVSGTLRSLLFEISPADPRLLGGCAAALIIASLAACAGPVIRAVRISPASAVRAD